MIKLDEKNGIAAHMKKSQHKIDWENVDVRFRATVLEKTCETGPENQST